MHTWLGMECSTLYKYVMYTVKGMDYISYVIHTHWYVIHTKKWYARCELLNHTILV